MTNPILKSKETRRTAVPERRQTSPVAGKATEPVSEQILQLQRAYGNQAVNQLLAGQQSLGAGVAPRVQAALRVGAADDHYEREADRVASQVMRQPNLGVQRDLDEEEGMVQAKPIDQIQRLADDPLAGFQTDSGFESQLQRSQSSGQPLSSDIRREMEPRFGADFSGVRIHTGAQSSSLNHQIQAKAFTHGNHIHFADGQFDPGSSQGKHLLAHELTHTIQQTGGVQPKRLATPTMQPKISAGGKGTLQRWNPFKWFAGLFKKKAKTPDSDYAKMIKDGDTDSPIKTREKKILEESQALLGKKKYSKKGVKGDLTKDSYQLAKSSGLTPDQLAAIRIYTSESYKVINPVLYEREGKMKQELGEELFGNKMGMGVTDELIEEYTNRANEHTKFAVEGLDKMPPYTGDVYRGSYSDRVLNMHREGEDVTYKNFMSTSTDRDVARDFSRGHTFITMTSKTGREIEKLSYTGGEDEVLFKPNTTFHVDRVVDHGEEMFMGMGRPNGARYDIEMTEV